MSVYGDRVLPRIINVLCGMKDLQPRRQQVCAGLTGKVVEIGFGSGLNVPHYPAGVASVDAVEPADLGWRLAAERLGQATVPVHRNGLDGQSLPFADGTFDCALSTFTLCTIPDVSAALAEVRRVLKPGGTLHFLEHGLAPDPKVQRGQRRVEPVQKLLFGGCHLTRDVLPMVESAGFTIMSSEAYYQPGGPKATGAMTIGTASSE